MKGSSSESKTRSLSGFRFFHPSRHLLSFPELYFLLPLIFAKLASSECVHILVLRQQISNNLARVKIASVAQRASFSLAFYVSVINVFGRIVLRLNTGSFSSNVNYLALRIGFHGGNLSTTKAQRSRDISSSFVLGFLFIRKCEDTLQYCNFVVTSNGRCSNCLSFCVALCLFASSTFLKKGGGIYITRQRDKI